MNKKNVLNNILKPDNMTGETAGFLVFKNYLIRVNGDSALFTDLELKKILDFPHDYGHILSFNKYLHLSKVFATCMYLITELYLNLVKMFPGLIFFINECISDYKDRFLNFNRPLIMTEKEYTDISKKYYEKSLKEIHTLEDLFLDRLCYYVDQELIPELWKAYNEEEKEKLCSPIDDIETFKQDFPKLYQIVKNDFAKLFKSGKLKADKTFSKIPLKDYDKIKFTGKQILKTGLPEIEKYFKLEEGYYSHADINYRGIAILKTPHPHLIDKKGHYYYSESNTIFESTYEAREKESKNNKIYLNFLINDISSSLNGIYFYCELVNGITDIADIKYKKLETIYNELENYINLFNGLISFFNKPELNIKEYDLIKKPAFDLDKREKLTESLKSLKYNNDLDNFMDSILDIGYKIYSDGTFDLQTVKEFAKA